MLSWLTKFSLCMFYSSDYYQFARLLYTCSITVPMLYCDFSSLYCVFLVGLSTKGAQWYSSVLSIIVSLDLGQCLTLSGYSAGIC